MIKICPECLNINIDTDICKTCGFPFGKKIIGRLEDYYFYESIELVNDGQIEEAKKILDEKQKIVNDSKIQLLLEKITLLEGIIKKADNFTQNAIVYFQKGDYNSAQTEIQSALNIYKHPRFIEIETLINSAIRKKQTVLNAESKFHQALGALKKKETIRGLNLLIEAINLDPDNEEIRNKYETELHNFNEQGIERIKQLITSKNRSDAEMAILEMLPFASNDINFQNLKTAFETSKRKRKSIIKLGAVLFILLIFSVSVALFWKITLSNRENEKWQTILDKESIDTYQDYIYKNRGSKYIPEAQKKLQDLLKKDSSLWNIVISNHQRYDIGKYLEVMERSGGVHIDEAKNMIDSIDWIAVARNEDITAFEQYLQKHPNGRYADLARNRISLTPNSTEQATILEFVSNYFAAFERRDLESVLMYYTPITSVFGSRKNITKADLRTLLENDLRSMSSYSIKIDPSSFKIKKLEEGGYNITFNSDTYITRIKPEVLDGQETNSEVSYFSNIQWFMFLNTDMKITNYRYKIISEQPINQ